MDIILDNNQVTLKYEKENDLLHDVYKADITFETIQTSLNKGLDLIKAHDIHKWLTDTRAIGGFGKDGAAWVINEWAPGAVEAGWKYWALVVPESMEGRAAMMQFMGTFAEKGVNVRVFTSEPPAREWLADL